MEALKKGITLHEHILHTLSPRKGLGVLRMRRRLNGPYQMS
jgi:hypothetical protein